MDIVMKLLEDRAEELRHWIGDADARVKQARRQLASAEGQKAEHQAELEQIASAIEVLTAVAVGPPCGGKTAAQLDQEVEAVAEAMEEPVIAGIITSVDGLTVTVEPAPRRGSSHLLSDDEPIASDKGPHDDPEILY